MIVVLNANRSNGTWNGVRTAILVDYFYRGGGGQTDSENTFILPDYMVRLYSLRFKITTVEESRVISVHVLFFFVHYVLCSPITENMHNPEITKIHDIERYF